MAIGSCFHTVLKSTIERNFLVLLENCQNNKDKIINFLTLLNHFMININTEERKGLPSDMKTKIEHIFMPTVLRELGYDYSYTVDQNNNELVLCVEKIERICVFYLIAYTVLVLSEEENRNEILNLIKVGLSTCNFSHDTDFFFQLYFDKHYKNNPNDFFRNLQTIFKLDSRADLDLKLAYCNLLMQNKENKTLIQLIHHYADYFIENIEEMEPIGLNDSIPIMVLLHILHQQVLKNNMEKRKRIERILSRIPIISIYYLSNAFNDYIQTLDNKQILCTPHLIKSIQPVMKEQPLDYQKIVLLCINRLRQANHYTECTEFIKCHFQSILSFPIDELTIKGECYSRQQYCITLFLLLNEYVSCHGTLKVNLVLTKLLGLRVSFLPDIHKNSCYCFMGNKKCSSTVCKSPKYKTGFENTFLNCYNRRLPISIGSIIHLCFLQVSDEMTGLSGYSHTFNLLMSQVIQGGLELAPYLQSIIDIMSKNMYKDESVLFFIEFIERSANKNEKSLYNIVKTLCAFDLQPEIQDMIIQELTAYFMILCNKQYCLLSKFILDINMICPKGQFLHKLTSDIAKSLFKFDDDTVKDFNNIIYKCYCTVRHDCKYENDTNITKYKDHFTFIASMEAEEEMKKLTSLTNFLLMLTLLLIASGGHHKSAELKKYLSLKYEYRDSILYLLWCSGDVEINPGPTLRTLRKLPDSVKERNWIYEMSSMLLRLLKYKSIDIRIDGLWKEKPLDWPVDSPFYDPRNKPKGKEYSIKTDRKLLENLEELCNGKGFFEEVTQFDDEHTKSKVMQYQKEITAWRTNKADLFELYILRQELDILLEAKTSLQKYKKESELKEGLSVLNVDLIFDSEEDMCISNAGYTDIVRDIAITLCRIGKGLDPLEKSDGIWKKPPTGWCLTDEYFSPCNAGKRPGKCKDPRKRQGNCKDRKLVDHLLRCCETMVQEYCKVNEKPVLIKLLHAWKHENVQEVRKYHTIWSNIEVIDNSLKYLKLEGLLAKSQTRIEKLGIKPRATDSKESIQDSTDLSSRPIQGKQTNPKCPTIIQSHQENHFDTTSKLRDSDASQKVVPLSLMGRKYQETDQTTQNNTNKRKHQSTDENYTEPKKLHGFDKGKSSPIHTSSTEQCQGEPINDQTPITVLDDILDLQDESNLNKNPSSFNIPPFIRSLMTISNEDTTHAVQQETPIETIVEYLKK